MRTSRTFVWPNLVELTSQQSTRVGLGFVPALAHAAYEGVSRVVTTPLVGDPSYVADLLAADPDELRGHAVRGAAPAAGAAAGTACCASTPRPGCVLDATNPALLRDAELVDLVPGTSPTPTWSWTRGQQSTGGTVADLAEDDARLAEMKEAMQALADVDVATLERHVAQTLDAASHRLDAWVTSLATRRLAEMRADRPKGLRVGGYGWVENLSAATPGPAVTDIPDEPVPARHPARRPGLPACAVPRPASAADLLRDAHLAHGGARDSPSTPSADLRRVRSHDTSSTAYARDSRSVRARLRLRAQPARRRSRRPGRRLPRGRASAGSIHPDRGAPARGRRACPCAQWQDDPGVGALLERPEARGSEEGARRARGRGRCGRRRAQRRGRLPDGARQHHPAAIVPRRRVERKAPAARPRLRAYAAHRHRPDSPGRPSRRHRSSTAPCPLGTPRLLAASDGRSGALERLGRPAARPADGVSAHVEEVADDGCGDLDPRRSTVLVGLHADRPRLGDRSESMDGRPRSSPDCSRRPESRDGSTCRGRPAVSVTLLRLRTRARRLWPVRARSTAPTCWPQPRPRARPGPRRLERRDVAAEKSLAKARDALREAFSSGAACVRRWSTSLRSSPGSSADTRRPVPESARAQAVSTT